MNKRGKTFSSIILILMIITSCKHSGNLPSNSSNENNSILISNNEIKLNLLLTKGFENSYDLLSPFSGIRIIDEEDQIYGFASIKNAKFTDFDNSYDLLSHNFNYDIHNFLTLKHWEQYFNTVGLKIKQIQDSAFTRNERWGEIIIGKKYTIKFPGTVNINTQQVGEYLEQIMARTDKATSLKMGSPDPNWYNDTSFIVSIFETLLSPEAAGGTNKILTVALVTPLSRKGKLYEELYTDLSYNTNVCVGKCEVKSISETFSLKATTPVEILFFFRNTSGMAFEINNFFSNIGGGLISFMNNYNVPFKIALTTISKPEKIKKWNNKYWLDQNDEEPSDFFNIPLTTFTRNNLISLGPSAVSSATKEGLFNNSSKKIIVFYSDRDDQSLTSNGEPISKDNSDQFGEIYKNLNIFPVGIIPLTGDSSFTCDDPQLADIFSSFLYRADGLKTNICSTHQSSFIISLVRNGMIFSSSATLSFPAATITSKCTFNHENQSWGFPNGYYISPYLKKIVITPVSDGKGSVSYSYFSLPH